MLLCVERGRVGREANGGKRGLEVIRRKETTQTPKQIAKQRREFMMAYTGYAHRAVVVN